MRAADQELLISLFGGVGHPLASRCAAQMADSPRFRAFLDEYRGKIGKKVRSLEGPASWQDLWLELWAAARLLSDRRFEVAYESYAAQKVRGPDLTATFRTHISCHIEIKHVRAELSSVKWAEVLCTKFGQFPPAAMNVLLVGTSAQIHQSCSVETAVGELGRLARRGENAVFQRYGLPGARDYFRHIVRLSGVLRAADWDLERSAQHTLWRNPVARHPLPPDLARALLALPAESH
ncbi:MAG: hypothetical protein ACLQUY_02395 [Ktedonobacterales bacterium]